MRGIFGILIGAALTMTAGIGQAAAECTMERLIYCGGCTLDQHGTVTGDTFVCGYCQNLRFYFSRTVCACRAEGIPRDCILRFKYNREMYFGTHLVNWLLIAARQRIDWREIDAIVQLPSGFGKPNTSGYPSGQAVVLYDQNSATAGQTVSSIIGAGFAGTNAQITRITPPLTVVTKSTEQSGLTAFDYAFTGLLGFSLLGLGVFGPINTLPALKKSGALGRYAEHGFLLVMRPDIIP